MSLARENDEASTGARPRRRVRALLQHVFPRVAAVARAASSSTATTREVQRRDRSDTETAMDGPSASWLSKIVRSLQGSSKLSADSLQAFNNILFLVNSIPPSLNSLSIFNIMLRSSPPDSDLLPFLAQVRIPKSTLGGTDYKTFIATLARVQQYLPVWYYSSLVLGRATGSFDKILLFAAQRFAQDIKTRQAVVSALVYPAFMLLLSIGGITLLLARILPQQISTFESMGLPVPASLAFVNLLLQRTELFWVSLAVLLPSALSSRLLPYRTHMRLQYIKLHMPLGRLRFLRDKAALLNVLSMLTAEQISSRLLLVCTNLNGNPVLQHMLESMAARAKSGASSEEVLSYMLTQAHVFSPYEVAYLQACFLTGKHATVQDGLRYLAAAAQREYKSRLDTLLGLLNPITTVLVGMLVAMIAFLGVGPLVQLTDAVSVNA